MSSERLKVLFLCNGNSARSQMAEAIMRNLSRDQVEVFSAGSTPHDEIHPMARRAVRALLGTEMDGQHPKSLAPMVGERFDYVITLCDKARENCPTLPEDPHRLHWSFDDPSEVEGSETHRQRAFDHTAHQLITRIRLWLSLRVVVERLAPRPHGGI